MFLNDSETYRTRQNGIAHISKINYLVVSGWSIQAQETFGKCKKVERVQENVQQNPVP